MSYISIDVESDGPIPGKYSMVCFGAVLVSDLSKTFYGQTSPISNEWEEDALKVSGFNRNQHKEFEDPKTVMLKFAEWIKEFGGDKPTFISDNNGFDWSFINYYFHMYLGYNPFRFSSRRIGDIYCGMVGNASSIKNQEWKKKYRKTKHTHNPLDDSLANAEALIAFRDELGFKIQF